MRPPTEAAALATVRERKAAGEAVGRCDDTDGWRARLQDFRRANARIRDAQEDVDAGVPAHVCFMQAVREVEDEFCGASEPWGATDESEWQNT